LFPELKALVGCPQEPEWHPEGDVWIHTLMVLDQARTRIDDLARPHQIALMLGAVCHDVGKPPTTEFRDGRIRSIDHEQAGLEPATRLLDRLNVHTMGGVDVRKEVLGMVAHHLKPLSFAKAVPQAGDGAFRRLAQKVDLELLARLAMSDCRGRGGEHNCSGITWFLERARALGVQHAAPDPIVKGRHLIELGVRPGPEMGEILRAIYERQLDGGVVTLEDGLAVAKTILASRADLKDSRN
jgi:tRNA nucleotidyltransferase (CCA-adding enzyme)